ncbi:hypothetical protein Syun_023059 [Stephania yunnanensis]|uniref:Uncharacterized protein n=1 Tax=Stephania yunnanensis TaxID=152371 RepID=A0AAP0FLD3_9MAGN
MARLQQRRAGSGDRAWQHQRRLSDAAVTMALARWRGQQRCGSDAAAETIGSDPALQLRGTGDDQRRRDRADGSGDGWHPRGRGDSGSGVALTAAQ